MMHMYYSQYSSALPLVDITIRLILTVDTVRKQGKNREGRSFLYREGSYRIITIVVRSFVDGP